MRSFQIWLIFALVTSFAEFITSSSLLSSNTLSTKSVELYNLHASKETKFWGIYSKWKKCFPERSAIHCYDAKNDPHTAVDAVHQSFAFVTKHLPQDLVCKLLSFPFDPNAPSALLIRGLPIDKHPPPTPVKDTVFDENLGDDKKSYKTILPVAESWLLGISRCLGTIIPPPRSKGDRGGLVRDITRNKYDTGDLPMHRDFPRQCVQSQGVIEPEMFILMGIRGDPHHETCTVVMDNRQLLSLMDDEDVSVLQRYKIQILLPIPDENGKETWISVGDPFHAIDPSDKTMITLFDLQNCKVTCPRGNEAVVKAYTKLQKLAFENGERVALEPGDMLIINNGRLVHGRTKFNSSESESNVKKGRWLIKSYITNKLWKVYGSGDTSLVDYPRVNAMDWIQ